jgi:hypothetical protein
MLEFAWLSWLSWSNMGQNQFKRHVSDLSGHSRATHPIVRSRWLIEFLPCCKPSNFPVQEKRSIGLLQMQHQLEEAPRSQDSTNTNITQIFPTPQRQDQFTPILDSFDMRWNGAR